MVFGSRPVLLWATVWPETCSLSVYESVVESDVALAEPESTLKYLILYESISGVRPSAEQPGTSNPRLTDLLAEVDVTTEVVGVGG